MPSAIDAVFYLARDPYDSANHARAVRDAFVAEFGLRSREVPLLRLHADGRRVMEELGPFELGE